MALSIFAARAAFEPLRSLAFGSISGAYAKVGTPLSNPARLIHVYNGCNTDMEFSIDGTNAHFYVPAGGFILFDFTTNHTSPEGFFIPQGTQFYVKQASAPGSGAVWITVVYGLALQP